MTSKELGDFNNIELERLLKEEFEDEINNQIK